MKDIICLLNAITLMVIAVALINEKASAVPCTVILVLNAAYFMIKTMKKLTK